MTRDERQKLREAALAAVNSTHAPAVVRRADTAAWHLQTSNSFRRIGAHGDGDVLVATNHWRDGQPDLLAPSGVLDYIVAAQPRVMLQLLDYIDMIEGRFERIDQIECELIKMRDGVEKMLKELSQ